jgi:hypothetical protein
MGKPLLLIRQVICIKQFENQGLGKDCRNCGLKSRPDAKGESAGVTELIGA